MKRLLLLSLLFSAIAQAQTATTVDKIRASFNQDTLTVYRVATATGPVLYKGFAGVKVSDDGNKALVTKSGLAVLKLIPEIGSIVVAPPVTPTLARSDVQQMIEDAFTKYTIYFGQTFSGAGTKDSPLDIKAAGAKAIVRKSTKRKN